MATSKIAGDLIVTGDLQVTTMSLPAAAVTNATIAGNAAIARSKLAQDTIAEYLVDWANFRVWNAYQTNLPGTSASDDLGLIGGTFGTNSPSIQTFDLKAAGATNLYARFFFRLPPEYDDGQTLQIRLHAGMLTTVADVSATADLVVYKSDKESGIGSDLITTAATTINSLTLADKDFTITETGLAPGDIFDVRLHLAINDGASGTAVKGIVGAVSLMMDIRG